MAKQGNTELTPHNSERELKHKSEYNAFVTWYSIPAQFRGLPSDKLVQLGIDEVHHELMKIKTQVQFAEKYKLNRDTLTDWKKRSHFDNDLKNQVDRAIFQKFYTRIVHAFSMKTIEHGDAQRFTAWMKMFAGHTEMVDVNINEEINVNGADVLEGQSIMDLVFARLKSSNRIKSQEQLDELESEIEDVSFVDLPSQNQYDFDKIQAEHSKKAKEPEPKKVDSDNVKSKLAESLKKLQSKKSK